VADTHAIIWYLYDDARLSTAARSWFADAAATGEQIALSTIVLAEMVYLIEKGRIDATAMSRLTAELDMPDALLSEVPLHRGIIQEMVSVPRVDVPDLPDRIIAATALHLGVPIISRDRKIQAASLTTVW
jgi:PIN domain nuclease of toxin-antitoxin system